MTGRSPRVRLGLVGYGMFAGIAASTLGAWVSSSISGAARIGVWIGVTALFALILAWFAEAVVMLLVRCPRHGLGRRPLSR
jgi:hypothetical protein